MKTVQSSVQANERPGGYTDPPGLSFAPFPPDLTGFFLSIVIRL